MALVGIARLASESPLLEAKRAVQYFEIPTRSILNRTKPSMPFHWTINPYRGCEFGCKYCYARYAHEFMELRDPLQFERQIFAKRFSASAFRSELKKVKARQSIWIGTATDPYQPAERRYRITRSMLQVFARERGFHLGVTTKSDLVREDADLIAAIAKQNRIQVNLTITTIDEALARLLEPMAPRPSLRLRAIRVLSEAGIRVTVLAHPVMPLINDSEASLDAIAAEAKKYGAVSFSAAPLFLKPCSAQVFLPFLQQHFPHLAKKYRERYRENAYLKGAYPELVRERLARITARHGLESREAEHSPEYWDQEPQLHLFGR